jgi:acetyl-CoA acyltransferase 1
MGIAAGVECMTMGFGAGAMPEKMSDAVTSVPEAADCLLRQSDLSILTFAMICDD